MPWVTHWAATCCLNTWANRAAPAACKVASRFRYRFASTSAPTASAWASLAALAKLGTLKSLSKLRTFWEFDDRVTAPLNGYQSVDDYYRRASSRYFLGAIETPTLIIQSEDDPFVFKHSIPEASELSACTELELHTKGGHVGFVEGSPRTPRYYLERRIPQWLASLKPESA